MIVIAPVMRVTSDDCSNTTIETVAYDFQNDSVEKLRRKKFRQDFPNFGR